MQNARPAMAKGLEVTPRDSRVVFLPKAPIKPEDLDVPLSLVEDIVLRYLYTKGTASLREVSKAIRLTFPLLHDLFQRMRQQQLFEITGMNGNDYIFTLSGIGREHAAKRFLISHYIGPVPVSLKAYNAAVRSQNTRIAVDRATLRAALADLVVTDRFLDDLGPAIVSQKSIFLYGPTGNGKTSIVTRLARIHQDTVEIRTEMVGQPFWRFIRYDNIPRPPAFDVLRQVPHALVFNLVGHQQPLAFHQRCQVRGFPSRRSSQIKYSLALSGRRAEVEGRIHQQFRRRHG